VRNFKRRCPNGKTATTVATDYIRELWRYAMKDIEEEQDNFNPQETDFRVVIGVPAVWSPLATDRMYTIAREAGLPENIELISEPEAAALSVLEYTKAFTVIR
jgi:molecular chaperone DnaK (HSP70)